MLRPCPVFWCCDSILSLFIGFVWELSASLRAGMHEWALLCEDIDMCILHPLWWVISRCKDTSLSGSQGCTLVYADVWCLKCVPIASLSYVCHLSYTGMTAPELWTYICVLGTSISFFLVKYWQNFCIQDLRVHQVRWAGLHCVSADSCERCKWTMWCSLCRNWSQRCLWLAESCRVSPVCSALWRYDVKDLSGHWRWTEVELLT